MQADSRGWGRVSPCGVGEGPERPGEGGPQGSSPVAQFLRKAITLRPSSAPVTSLPPFAIRSTPVMAELNMKAKMKAKADKAKAVANGKPKKGVKVKKVDASFTITWPSVYYGAPSYNVANVKPTAGTKKKKATPTK